MATLGRIYLEELRGLPRARFALGGAAALAALLTLLAALVGAQQGGVTGLGIIAYAMAPALFAGFAAAQVSGLRASRFTHSLYTTPVRQGEVLAAKVAVSLTVCALYLLATLPFVAVGGMHVGVAEELVDFFLMGAGVLVFATAFGTLLGVLFTGRSMVAPIALSVGFLVLSIFAVPYAIQLLSQPRGADSLVLHVLHLSPHLLMADAVGLLTHESGHAIASPGFALALVLGQSAVLLALAWWAYAREQGVEGWEAPFARRALLATLVVAVLVSPVALASTTYTKERAEPDFERFLAWSDDRNGTAHLVAPGTPAAEARFGDFFAGTFEDPLLVDRANVRDILLRLPLPAGTALADVRARVEGEDVAVEPAERDLGLLASPEASADAQLGRQGPVVRIPVTLTPSEPRSLGGNYHAMTVHLTYRLDNETTPREVAIHFPVRADVAHAELQMVAAGAPLVLLPAIAGIVRRVRVG